MIVDRLTDFVQSLGRDTGRILGCLSRRHVCQHTTLRTVFKDEILGGRHKRVGADRVEVLFALAVVDKGSHVVDHELTGFVANLRVEKPLDRVAQVVVEELELLERVTTRLTGLLDLLHRRVDGLLQVFIRLRSAHLAQRLWRTATNLGDLEGLARILGLKL